MAKKSYRELMAGRGQGTDINEKSLEWWREARFGLFIHWGLYALPAGVWKGEEVEGIGEWIMHRARIPIREYEPLAKEFNPVDFDAVEWVALAKRAGMKYLVITAKHHDGFALFHSPSDPYNIVDGTPFGRDPMKELAEACADAGIKLGFYYSQDQDWHDPDGAWNDWDFDEEKKNFGAYLERKVEPQLRELLTQYGPIGLIWFDTPYTISKEHSTRLKALVRSIQPDCLVSGRVGHDLGDYGSLGDNQIPAGRIDGDYETPATMNDTWGYKSGDHNWKSVDRLLFLLADLAGKGVNYLLNVGPTAKGRIPDESIERLTAIGEWMDTCGEAIHATQAGPFPYELPGVRMTRKGNTLYLLFLQWPGASFVLRGLETEVKSARILGYEAAGSIEFTQARDEELALSELRLSLPAEPPVSPISVVALDLAGECRVEELPLQQPDGSISLPVFMAQITPAGPDSMIEVARPGHTIDWKDSGDLLRWRFKVTEDGEYAVSARSMSGRSEPAESGNAVQVQIVPAAGGDDTQSVTGEIGPDEKLDTPRGQYFPEYASPLGTVRLSKGVYECEARATHIDPELPDGVKLSGIGLSLMG
jgi:alpha-L-fucosidase